MSRPIPITASRTSCRRSRLRRRRRPGTTLRARRRPPTPTFSSAIIGAPITRRRRRFGWCSRSRPAIDLFDLPPLPNGVAVCNAYGHETAIAEYVVMVCWRCITGSSRFRGEFRDRGSWRTSWVQSGAPHGEVRGSTLGIVGYGRVGREVARRAAPFGCRILAANRSPREADPGVERVYPLADLDQMLPLMRHGRAVHRARPGNRPG